MQNPMNVFKNISKMKNLYILSFFFALHISLSAYVNSIFLTEFFSEKYVGLLYTMSSVITLILLSASSVLLQNFGNRRFVFFSLFSNMISLIGLILSENPFIIAISFIALLTTNTLIMLSIDIFVEHFGNKNTIGKTRGFFLTILNLAWVISPLITGFIMTKEGGYKSIYVLAFIAVSIMTFGLVFLTKSFTDRTYTRTPFFETYKYLKNNHNIFAIIMINFLLQFFFAIMVVYIPIYLFNHLGFDWSQISIIFTFMLLPFVLLSIPVGILIDKFNFKKRSILRFGFFIIILSTLVISFISTKNVALWAFILFMTRVGASLIETTSEIYFFTHIKEEETYLLGIFRDMRPVSFIVAPILVTSVFLFLSFKFIFLVLACVLIVGFYYISKLRHDHVLENN